jgi:beta-mannosidase
MIAPPLTSHTLLDWQVGWTTDSAKTPNRFVPAAVPGAVQLDWARAEGWPPYWQAENFRAYAWMEDVHWIYRTRLKKPSIASDQRLALVCGGVDYACTVRVGGCVVHSQEGTFSPFEIDLTKAVDGALIEIIVAPAPKAPMPPDIGGGLLDGGRKESRQSCKPAVAYGWDFHPRLIPLGIWEETYLEVRLADSWLKHVEVAYELADDYSAAVLRLVTEGKAGRVRWTVKNPSGAVVASQEGLAELFMIEVKQPELWWPNTEGEPVLYKSIVETLNTSGCVVQTCEQSVGLRRIRLVMSPGQFERAGGLPATQPPVPITFEVNGRAIFARGANWVCPEIFPGTLTPERYRDQLALFAGANFNLLRAWGGATVNKTAFFEHCDELGILVWQEFPLACNRYDGTPAYLRVLDQESCAIIRRCRRHACLARWCGGNELFNAWSGMTMQDHALRLLNRNCFDLDPTRPFLPTSPLHGMRHGDYRFKMSNDPDLRTVFQCYPSHAATAYMEFGVPAPPAAARLREIIPADEVWPLRPTSAWKAHHAFGAWNPDEPTAWLYPEVAEHYFGPSQSLEQLVSRLQLLQAEGYKAIYEEGRRQKPVCSAVACWAFNEPWPCAANNSLVAWPTEPKPAYHAVAAANRPVMASARIPRFDWVRGAVFSVTLFLLNDSPQAVGPLTFNVRFEAGSVSISLGTWNCPGSAANTHRPGPEVAGRVPDCPDETFDLVVEVGGRPELSSRYTLAFSRQIPGEPVH